MQATVRRWTGSFRLLLLAATLFVTGGFIAACGGGGGGGGPTGPPAGSVRSLGELTQAQSIIVNGVHFETEGAELEMENELNQDVLVTLGADDSALRDGMVVEVRGSADDATDDGIAQRIRHADLVEGPIANVVAAPGGLVKSFEVLGLTVIAENGVTHFDPSDAGFTFASLEANSGVVVEVSGLMRSDGSIQATFLDRKADNLAAFLAAGGLLEVEGMVSNLNSAASTFSVNGVPVSFTGVTPRDGTLADGAIVEVKGNDFSNGVLTATDIEVRGADDDVAKVEIEGFITGLAGSSFMLGGQMVSFSDTTIFRGGIRDDLANGVKVEAEGPISGGVLQAVKITFKETVRIEDNALAALSGGSLTLANLGLIVIVDDLLTDNRVDPTAPIAAGDGLRIRGRVSGAANDTLVATRLEKVDPVNRVELQGPATGAAPIVTIIGINVDTSTIREDDPSGSNFEIEDAPVTSAVFFSTLASLTDPIVKARADLPGLAWDQIEIELEDSQ